MIQMDILREEMNPPRIDADEHVSQDGFPGVNLLVDKAEDHDEALSAHQFGCPEKFSRYLSRGQALLILYACFHFIKL
jgi:hypothetical protein